MLRNNRVGTSYLVTYLAAYLVTYLAAYLMGRDNPVAPTYRGEMTRMKRTSATDLVTARAGGAVDQRLVERAVQDLKKLVVGGLVKLSAEVGEYLIEHVYLSVANARSRAFDKAATLRALGERAAEFGMTSAGLAKAVPIALQVRELGRPLALRLGPAHHVALLPLQNRDEKKLLAESAVEERWTVVQLRDRVRRLKKPHPGGRRPRPPLAILVEATLRLYDKELLKTALYEDLDAIAPAEARRLLTGVVGLQGHLERIQLVLVRLTASGE